MPWMPVTDADRVRTKSVGSFWMSAQVMPISVILIGSQVGHLKLSPVAAPTLMKTPKPGLVTKVPSPRKAKLRPSPPSTSEPIVTSAPTERKLTISSLAAADVLISRSVAVSVRTGPERNAQRVGVEDQPLDLAVLELEGEANGFGIRHVPRVRWVARPRGGR
jgi:hypothetical protein